MAGTLKFVDAIGSTTTRMDLNAKPIQWLHDNTSFGSPGLTDAGRSAVVEYEDRELSIPLRITGNEATARSLLQALARELLRTENYLLVQRSSSGHPMWFRTFASKLPELDEENVRGLDGAGYPMWDLMLRVDAEPFAYGALETLGPYTMVNNPAAGSNPSVVTLPAVKGDAPAPLSASVRWSTQNVGHALALTLSSVIDPYMLITTWTQGNSQARVADSAYVAGGSYPVASPIVAGSDNMVSKNLAPTVPGRHRVLLRVNASATEGLELRASSKQGNVEVLGPWVRHRGGTYWMDLGVLPLPPGRLGAQDNNGCTLTTFARRTGSGSGASIDAAVLIPVEDTTGSYQLQAPAASTLIRYAIDGDRDAEAVATTAVSTWMTGTIAAVRGAIPLLRPGLTNVLRLFAELEPGVPQPSSNTISDPIAASAAVTITYRPRYVFLALP